MKILLVEDEPDLGQAIQQVLSREKYIVDWVQDGTEAWSYLETPWAVYTMVILDWLLPGTTGIEICKRLRRRNSSIPILMLTAKDSMADKVTGLDAGADDYLVKPFGMAELLARLRALQRRSVQPYNQTLQLGRLSLDYATSTVSVEVNDASQVVQLTAKEFQLLEHFMRHPQQIITRDQLMNALWGMQSEPASNVVSAQMRLLRRKLADYGCDGMIETLYGLGYRLNLTDAPESTI